MEKHTPMALVRNRIDEYAFGTVFTISDFADIADQKTIHVYLNRLLDEGVIDKVMRGIYYKSKYSNLLGEKVHANPNEISQAIARNNGWDIIPSEATVLNIMGLSTQVPAKWEYISNGPYKKYITDDGLQLIFKHTNRNTELTRVSYKTALVIHAIKALGKDRINGKDIKILSNGLTTDEKRQVLDEAKYCTSWIYEKIKLICKDKVNA